VNTVTVGPRISGEAYVIWPFKAARELRVP
jgi:hypothetical protein